jgi:hypothetical protein
LQGGQAGQFNLAPILQALSTTYAGGPTGYTFPAAATLGAEGTALAGSGGAGTLDISQIMKMLGLTTGGTGADVFQQGVQTETTGTLPQGAQDLVKQTLADRTAQIKGKWAQFGMTGSSDEANELDQAKRQSGIDQFTLAQTVGSALTQQGLAEQGQGFNLVSGAGGLQATLAQLGIGALGTSGSLGTTLGQLGLSGLNFSSQDYTNLATEGIDALNLESNIFGGIANQQIAQDSATTTTLGNFFKALAGNSGAFGTQGVVPGVTNLFKTS